jgi:protein CWC15
LVASEAAAAKTKRVEDFDDSDVSFDSSDSSSSDEDDDDQQELLRELRKIKKERAAEKKQQELQRIENEKKSQEESMLAGNPLLSGSAVLKRRWDDDCVFKNQARDAPEMKKRFINDTIRNDFHRKFLAKYIH